ncbi:hypothetical protein B9Z19DRAFT_1066927 [Tuber borchii]|uniref:Uncharacterized protein n=1 Tax=Tuber borchii TaxID=42251 RepID=A0A2T6ZKT6_TUBBO|nr:hypothetical protein B9Z19DRAFT_1066927 [Tuber borchii]
MQSRFFFTRHGPFKYPAMFAARFHTATVVQAGYRKKDGPHKPHTAYPTASKNQYKLPPETATLLTKLANANNDAQHSRILEYLKFQARITQAENEKFREHLAIREREQQMEMKRLIHDNRELYAAFRRERNERGRWDSNFNLRGAVDSDTNSSLPKQKKSLNGPSTKRRSRGGGIQANLNQIMELSEFKETLSKVLKDRGLRGDDVWHCLNILYPTLSKYAHGNDGDIVLRGIYHPDNERAGLVALMRVQGRWKEPCSWREEPEEVDY